MVVGFLHLWLKICYIYAKLFIKFMLLVITFMVAITFMASITFMVITFIGDTHRSYFLLNLKVLLSDTLVNFG